MGLSTPVTAETVARRAGTDPATQAEYLKHFRADNAVKDLEAIRQCLTAHSPKEQQKWSVMGQSYGGFVGISYLSKYPGGLREVFTMGGLPPVTVRGPEEIYRRLVKKVKERNRVYYKKFDVDGLKVRKILNFLTAAEETGSPVTLPGGGLLTAKRFRQLGIFFGAHGGLDAVHDIVLKAENDLDLFGFLTRPTLSRIEAAGSFDNHPIYAVLHEPIYCQGGVACSWAAQRVVSGYPEFDAHSENPSVYFTGEMVFKHNFEEYPELKELGPAAMLLAENTDWTELYDIEQLKKNEVPVYSSTYIDDMYVDFQFAQETARLIKGCKTFVTNAML
jgi:pimeloyl-ACP methyl ester carboxylesterase